MFKRVVNYKGFWKSVFTLSVGYLLIFLIIQWIGYDFSSEVVAYLSKIKILVALLIGSFIGGFSVSYGLFWKKIKEQDYRK